MNFEVEWIDFLLINQKVRKIKTIKDSDSLYSVIILDDGGDQKIKMLISKSITENATKKSKNQFIQQLKISLQESIK